METLWPILALVLLFAVLIALGVFLTTRRERAIEHFAMVSGFSFEDAWAPEVDENGKLVATKSSLPELAGNDMGTYWNVLRGRVAGFYAAVFEREIKYSEYAARQTVAAFALPEATVPKFVIRQEDWTDKMLHFPGFSYTSTARLLEAQGFHSFRCASEGASKPWQIFALSKTDIQQFLTEPMMDLFDQILKDRWSIEGDRNWIIVYVINQLAPPNRLDIFLDETSQIARLIFTTSVRTRIDV